MIVPSLRALATPIGELLLLDGNPRRGDVDAVAASLRRFGQRKPIVALPDGTVIAGNHTLQAARQLGWDEIAVVRVDDDEDTAKAYALADNRTAELGTYDVDALRQMVEDVQAYDEALLTDTGWFGADLAALLGDLDAARNEPGDGQLDTSSQLDGMTYRVLIECRDERHQAELLHRFEGEGLSCRALMT